MILEVRKSYFGSKVILVSSVPITQNDFWMNIPKHKTHSSFKSNSLKLPSSEDFFSTPITQTCKMIGLLRGQFFFFFFVEDEDHCSKNCRMGNSFRVGSNHPYQSHAIKIEPFLYQIIIMSLFFFFMFLSYNFMVVYNYFLVEEWMRDRQRTTNRLCTIFSVLFKIC